MKRRFALFSVVAFAAALSATAEAKPPPRDVEPPVINHAPVLQAEEGAPLMVRARIVDASEIFAPAVYVRPRGAVQWDAIAMERVGGTYEARIPAEQVTGPLEYFIEAFDEEGNGPARAGSPEEPIVVTTYPAGSRRAEASATPPPVATPSSIPGAEKVVIARRTSPSEEEDDGGSVAGKWWFWTIIGVAVTGGIATAVLLTRDSGPLDRLDIQVRGPDPAAGL